MKSLQQFINETSDDKLDFNTFVDDIDKAFEYAGIKMTKMDPNTNEVVKYGSLEDGVTYKVLLGMKPGKSRLDTGATLSLMINANINVNGAGVNIVFSWNNGKQSYSIYSNVHKSKHYELDFGTKEIGHTLFKKSYGGFSYQEMTPKIANNVINGIKGLRIYKDMFNAAMEKSRFTDAAWNKLCKEIDYLFNLK